MSFDRRWLEVRNRVLGGLLMCLALPGCADVDGDLPRPYRQMDVPLERLASAEAKEHGARLFAEHCALCHGERGDGSGPRREGLSRSPRDFTNATWKQSATPRRVFHSIREGVPGTPMASWKALSEHDAWDMTAYVLSLGE
jgi:mono/diheme cytochrome c family protein